MPVNVTDIDTFQKYFLGVVTRANHHAPRVAEIIYGLVGIIILKKDAGTHIKVRGSNEDATGNILWVTIRGKVFAFRYEHSTDEIEIRDGSYSGPLLFSIDNTTPLSAILAIF